MDANGRPSTILLKSPNSRYDEKKAGAAGIKPGYLVKANADDEAIVHSTAGGYAAPMFVTEELQVLVGKTKDDVYTEDEPLSLRHFLPGDMIQAWLKDGENVTRGDALMSGGNGQLVKYVADTEAVSGNAETLTIAPNHVIAYAEETYDASGVGDLTRLLKVRIA